MASTGNTIGRPLDLNMLAASLEDSFRSWSELEPLVPRPQFMHGPAEVDKGLPRFGIAQVEGNNSVTIDPAYADVVAAVILREIVRTYIPPHCLVDITHDLINRFCGFFLTSFPSSYVGLFNAPRWQTLIRSHSWVYNVYYLGTSVVVNPDTVEGGMNFLRIFLRKLRQHASLISPDKVTDTLTSIVLPLSLSLHAQVYSPEEAEFIALLADYMKENAAFPTPKRLAGGRSGWTLRRCETLSRQLADSVVNPTYFMNPGALGQVFCWILLETPPGVSNYLVRNLIYLPFATQSFCQCVGTPLPTYFTICTLPPNQLDEFSGHLTNLKQNGLLLDYQIFRAERSVDLVNWNETLSMPAPYPLVNETKVDYELNSAQYFKSDVSWFILQSIGYFGFRVSSRGAMTHLDAGRNYQSFLEIVEQAALLLAADVEKDLAVALPLLNRFRNVEYVIRLLNLASDLLRHLFAHPDTLVHGLGSQGQDELGRLGVPWQYFPARDWLMALFNESVADGTRQGNLLVNLSLAVRLLRFFAPFTVPLGTSPEKYLQNKQQALATIIKGVLGQIPPDEASRLQYFTTLHDKVVSDRFVIPRISLSPVFPPSSEDFYFFARTSRPWDELIRAFAARFAAQVYSYYFLFFRDQSGAPVVGGIVRATHTQFRAFRRGLVGLKGVLGTGASLLIGRRVPFWSQGRRDFVETYDFTSRGYGSIQPYLDQVVAEHLVNWAHPRSLPLAYVRKILAEPYLGPVEQAPRPPPNVVKLIPKMVSALKESFLSGISTLHPLVGRRLGIRQYCDLNWPAYGLERYFLHVYLSTRQPKYIFTHLITPATRRVFASAAVSGFQTVLIEYLWPAGAPDDHFLQYLYSRTEKNVLAYSVHRVLSDTRFFNLDKAGGQEAIGNIDAIDLQVLMLAHSKYPAKHHSSEITYDGEKRYAPGSAGWEVALDYFNITSRPGQKPLPPDSRPMFDFDPRSVGFSEKVALAFRGQFDALPLCQSLPFGHYYRTEEVYYSSTERLIGQPGHIIVFDFPSLRMSQLDTFLDDLLRDPAVKAHSTSSLLMEQNLSFVQGVALARINPLRANPFDVIGGHYIHLPKRQLQEGKWHTLSLLEQMELLNKAWMHAPSTKHE